MPPSTSPSTSMFPSPSLILTMGLVLASTFIVGTSASSAFNPARVVEARQVASSGLPTPFLTMNNIGTLSTCTGVILEWTYEGPNLPMEITITNAGVDQSQFAPSPSSTPAGNNNAASKRDAYIQATHPGRSDANSLSKRVSFPILVVLPLDSSETISTLQEEYLYEPIQLPSGWYTAIAQVFLKNSSDTQDTFISPRAQAFFVNNGTDTSCVITQSGGTPSVTASSAPATSTKASQTGGGVQTSSSAAAASPIGAAIGGSSSVNKGAIAGGVIGGLAVIAAIIAALLYIRYLSSSKPRSVRSGSTSSAGGGGGGAAGLRGSGSGKWKKTRRNSRKWGGLTSVDSSLGVDYDHNGAPVAPGSGRERKHSSVSELAGIPALPSGDITETKRASHKSKSPSSTLAQPSPVYHRPGSYTMEPIVGNGHHPTSDSRDNRSSRRQSIPLPSPSASTDLNHFTPGSVASTSTTLLGTSPPLTTTSRSLSSRSPPPPPGAWTGGSPGAHSVFSTVSDPFGSELGHGHGGSSSRSSANPSQQQIQSVAVAPSGYMRTPSSNSTTERDREGDREGSRSGTSNSWRESDIVPHRVSRTSSNDHSNTNTTSNTTSKSSKNRRRASVEGTGTSTGRGERDRKVPPKVPPPPIKTSNSNTSSNSHSNPNTSYPPSASRSPTSPATMKKSSSSNSRASNSNSNAGTPTVATAAAAAASASAAAAIAVANSTTSTPTPSTQGHVRGQSSSQQQKKKTPRKPVPVYDASDINPDITSSSPPSNSHHLLSASAGGMMSTSVSSSYGSVSPLAAAMHLEPQGSFGKHGHHQLSKSGSTPNLHSLAGAGSSSDLLTLGGPGKPGHYTPTSSKGNSRVDLSKMLAEDGGPSSHGHGSGSGNEQGQGGGGLTHKGSLNAFSGFPGADGGRPVHYLIPDMPPPSRE